MKFNNKTAWIVGASSGIGEALAYELSKQGAQLIISSRNQKELERVKKNCENSESVTIAVLDLENTQFIDKVVDEIMILFDTG